MFQLCEEPVFSPQVASLTAKLEGTLVQRGLREPYACASTGVWVTCGSKQSELTSPEPLTTG